MRRVLVVSAVLVLTSVCFLIAQQPTAPPPAKKASAEKSAASAPARPAYPEILEANEGEQRVRRPREMGMASGSFILKVDRQNGRSRQMWLGTEELKPGAVIPKHKHIDQDEILLVQSGTAHVNVGDLDRDANPGAVIFIPAGTWITLKNVGKDNLALAFVFSAPGFDDYLRCTSVAPGETPRPQTPAEVKQCAEKGHVVYESLEQNAH